MDEELKQKLSEYLDQLESGIQQAGGFVIDEVPLVVKEYLNWEIYSYGFSAVVSLIVAILFSVFFIKLLKYLNTTDEIDTDCGPYVLCWILSGFITIISLVTCVSNTYSMIKPIVAPRVVIIEKISELTRNSGFRN